MEEHCRSSGAFFVPFHWLIRICWSIGGTCDQLNFGSVAAVEVLARQIQIYVVVDIDPGSVFCPVGDSLVTSLRWHLLGKLLSSGRPGPLDDDPVDVCRGMLEVQAATMLPTCAKSILKVLMVRNVGMLTRAAIEAM